MQAAADRTISPGRCLPRACSGSESLWEKASGKPPAIWEFPVADFLVCARPDVHGLFILSPSARLAWTILKETQTMEGAAEMFAQECGISAERAFEDMASVRGEWSSGLLAPSAAAKPIALPKVNSATSPLVFSADYLLFGKAIRLKLYDADLARDVTPRVDSLRTAPSTPDTVIEVIETDRIFNIFVDGIQVGLEETLFAARVTVLQEFVKGSSSQGWLAILHAGACGSDSRCIVFPAASHSGKTTLAAALVHQGFTFYGDDSVPLERGSLRVQPMPFALMIREGSWSTVSALFEELHRAPIVDRWGEYVRFLSPPTSERKLDADAAAIVFTQYRPDAQTDLQRLETFEALLRLRDSGLRVEHDPESISAFLRWFESIPSYSLTYSSLEESADILEELLCL